MFSCFSGYLLREVDVLQAENEKLSDEVFWLSFVHKLQRDTEELKREKEGLQASNRALLCRASRCESQIARLEEENEELAGENAMLRVQAGLAPQLGSRAENETARLQKGMAIGDSVEVLEAFATDNAVAVFLERGRRGTVREIDEEGDAQIDFGLEIPHWVCEQNLGCLQVLPKEEFGTLREHQEASVLAESGTVHAEGLMLPFPCRADQHFTQRVARALEAERGNWARERAQLQAELAELREAVAQRTAVGDSLSNPQSPSFAEERLRRASTQSVWGELHAGVPLIAKLHCARADAVPNAPSFFRISTPHADDDESGKKNLQCQPTEEGSLTSRTTLSEWDW